MSKYFVPDSAFGQEAECPICACLWTDPVEIQGCEHILCRECVQSLKSCPTCNHEITKLNTPNPAILRMLMRVRGRCSCCEWKGTYKDFKEAHGTCLKSGERPSTIRPSVTPNEEKKEAERMQDYFMEDALPPFLSPVAPPGPAPWGTSGATAQRTSPQLTAAPLPYSAASSGQQAPDMNSSVTGASASVTDAFSTGEAYRWRESLNARAADYGLTESEFKALKERFTDFASRSSLGTPVLRWRGACRLLRYFNYPNHPDDVKNMFETAQQSYSTGSVSFHALCLWLALNKRNPQQWYGMKPADYNQILRVAQVLDVDKKGLFTLDQASLLAEQYFQRDISGAEWESIVKVLCEKDETIRQYFQDVGNFSALNRDFRASLGDVKLPFHDILITFRSHVENLKRQQREAESGSSGVEYAERIKRMIQHYEPAAIHSIDNTIAQFRGEEGELLQTLIAMYGPEPAGR